MSKPTKDKAFAKAFKNNLDKMVERCPELIPTTIKDQLKQNGFEDVTIHWIGNDEIVYSEDVKVSDLPDDLNTKT